MGIESSSSQHTPDVLLPHQDRNMLRATSVGEGFCRVIYEGGYNWGDFSAINLKKFASNDRCQRSPSSFLISAKQSQYGHEMDYTSIGWYHECD